MVLHVFAHSLVGLAPCCGEIFLFVIPSYIRKDQACYSKYS